MFMTQVDPFLCLADILGVGVYVLITKSATVVNYVVAPPFTDLLKEMLLGAVKKQVETGVPLAAAKFAKSRVFVSGELSAGAGGQRW